MQKQNKRRRAWQVPFDTLNFSAFCQEGLAHTARDNILVVNICALGVGAKKQSCKYHRVAKTWEFPAQTKKIRTHCPFFSTHC